MSWGKTFSNAWNAATDIGKAAAADIATGAKWVGGKTQQVATAIAETTVRATDWAARQTKAAAQVVTTAAKQVASTVKDTVKEMSKQVGNATTAALDVASAVRKAGTAAGKSVATKVEQVFTAAKETFNDAVVGTTVALCQIKEDAKKLAKRSGPAIAAAGSALSALALSYKTIAYRRSACGRRNGRRYSGRGGERPYTFWWHIPRKKTWSMGCCGLESGDASRDPD